MPIEPADVPEEPDPSNPSAKVGRWVWTNRAVIWGTLAGIHRWFRGPAAPLSLTPTPAPEKPAETSVTPKGQILIIGPGGVGKTTLGKLLAGEYDFLFDGPGRYQETKELESYSLTDHPELEIVIPPGQEHRRAVTWDDLKRDVAQGLFRGIILLSAFGYHALSISYKSHRIYAEGNTSQKKFLAAYRADRLQEELKVLRDLAPQIMISRGAVWMLTVVTKRDLWYNKQVDVERHYREGEYGQLIADIAAKRGERAFRHEWPFASLTIQNFEAQEGERLEKNLAGYDHLLHVESLRSVFEAIGALKMWEANL